jgi:hypothetical protein
MNKTPVMWAFEFVDVIKIRFEHAHDYIIFWGCPQKSLMLRVGI